MSTTIVNWGRTLSEAEEQAITGEINQNIQAGLTSGDDTRENTTITRVDWTTLEAATQWIAYVNTYTPPPVSAVAS